MSQRPAVRCRPIAAGDRDQVVDRLTRGFPARGRAHWERAVEKLDRHVAEQAFQHYGYVLQVGEEIVGALLMIFKRGVADGTSVLSCNLSSWCVDDAYRSYAPLLVNAATRDKAVTYFNISPEKLTRSTVEAQGFRKYCEGLFLALPLLSWPTSAVRCIDGEKEPRGAVNPDERALMRGHAGLECLRMWCEADGNAYPFLFAVGRRFRGRVPTAHLVYCPDTALLRRYAHPIGRFLARHGIFVLGVDATEPLAGLTGWFVPSDMPKYFKGPHRPRLGDLAYTELPMFGF